MLQTNYAQKIIKIDVKDIDPSLSRLMFEEISKQGQDNLCLYCRENTRAKDSLFCSTKCVADMEYHLQKQREVNKFLDGYQKLEF